MGRQDAMDDHLQSPAVHKKQMKQNDPEAAVVKPSSSETPTSPPQSSTSQTKSKRATSFIRKKPKLERGMSDQSVLKLNKNPTLGKILTFLQLFILNL